MNDSLFDVPVSPKASDDVVTPAWVFESMGLTFDLDPCGSLHGDHVPARRRYTAAEDGLSVPWAGRVWLNPPFSKPAPWMERFMNHRWGIALTVVSRGYWCLRLWEEADWIAMPRKPFNFTTREGFLYPVMFSGYGIDPLVVADFATVRERPWTT